MHVESLHKIYNYNGFRNYTIQYIPCGLYDYPVTKALPQHCCISKQITLRDIVFKATPLRN